MRLTRAADYAVRGMVYLASRNGRRRVLINEIATAESVPPSFLAKIFQQLRKAGLVASHRGSKGGFRLRLSPKYIRLRDIIEAAQGSVTVTRNGDGGPGSPSPLDAVCEKIDAQIVETLEATSLSELVQRYARKSS